LVAAYLGAHAGEGYQPSEYLVRLRNEGLFGVDTLAGDPNVAKEIRHDPVAERNRMATLIGWSLDRLSPPARAALEFASLLQPDQIPLSWLELLTRQQHEAALTDQPGHPSLWGGVWRELHGLRLLHPAEASEVDEQHQRKLPQVVRIHRLVAEHVTQANPQAERTVVELDQFLDVLTTQFEQQVGQSEDAALRAQHPWLRDHLSHLITYHATRTLLTSAGVAADFEGEHNTLSRALELNERILKGNEKLLAATPDSTDLARDVSVSLDKLADFLARRGLPGDAEQALRHYERCHQVLERLRDANPESAEAARDVKVSLERMAQAVAAQPDADAVQRALEHQSRALGIALKLRESNPQSVYYGRTAAVSFFLTFQRAQAAGQEELANQCLAGCHAVLHQLITAGCQLDPPMMGLYQQLNAAAGGPPSDP
ncbi:MAG: hypothetical protein H7062_21360, partial [Candidatus Saccharimonas sp.]|nr:hypothetical protein [Planctomycetaceae bacterium]